MTEEQTSERVFRLVSEADATLREFAAGIGVSDQVVGNWRSRGRIPAKRLYVIADWLSRKLQRPITVDTLHHGENAAPDWQPRKPAAAIEASEIDRKILEYILDAVDERKRGSGDEQMPNSDLAALIADTYAEMIQDIQADYRARVESIVSRSAQSAPLKDNKDRDWSSETKRGKS